MQLSHSFSGLVIFVLALAGAGKATPLTATGGNEDVTVGTDEPATYLMSNEQMMHWIANTDAEITFIGEPINALAPAQRTVVTFCSHRIDNVCGGPCTVYNGPAACIDAPDTQCLAATKNVGFCTGGRCTGTCNELSTCRTMLSDGYCFAPGTKSILVGA